MCDQDAPQEDFDGFFDINQDDPKPPEKTKVQFQSPLVSANGIGAGDRLDEIMQQIACMTDEARATLLAQYAAAFAEYTSLPVTHLELLMTTEDGSVRFRFVPRCDRTQYVVMKNDSPMAVLPECTPEHVAEQILQSFDQKWKRENTTGHAIYSRLERVPLDIADFD